MTENRQTNYSEPNYAQEQYTPVAVAGQSPPAIMFRRIGSTNYRVCVHFSSTSRETMNDKILRLVKREAVSE